VCENCPRPRHQPAGRAEVESASIIAARKIVQSQTTPADNGDLDRADLEPHEGMGGKVYIPGQVDSTGGEAGIWQTIFIHWLATREGVLKHYHARGRVEFSISAIKRQFGDSVRSPAAISLSNEQRRRARGASCRPAAEG
jgi:hypothetical protein